MFRDLDFRRLPFLTSGEAHGYIPHENAKASVAVILRIYETTGFSFTAFTLTRGRSRAERGGKQRCSLGDRCIRQRRCRDLFFSVPREYFALLREGRSLCRCDREIRGRAPSWTNYRALRRRARLCAREHRRARTALNYRALVLRPRDTLEALQRGCKYLYRRSVRKL